LNNANVSTRRTWLIQRLEKPVKPFIVAGKEIDNPFSFGGGLKNGGLSDTAMGHLRKIMSFDYMGSAEFEFCAVPAAFQMIAQAADKELLVTGKCMFNSKDIYYLAPKDMTEYVEKVICDLCNDKLRLKEASHLDYVVNKKYDWQSTRTVGWLELNNGFMFFTDKVMFTQVCELFGVK